jgi:Flp pilus assembly protein TadB
MTDKIMAILALATMIVFLGVVAWFVPDINLIIVITLVSLLAIYDFWQMLRAKGNDNGN